MKKRPLKQRLQYLFDNLMAKGMVSKISVLLAITLFFIFILGVITSIVMGDIRNLIPWSMWMTLLHTLDPGTISGTEGRTLFIVLMTVATFYGLFFTAILIGLINDGITGKMDALAKGKSNVLEEGHVLILGFNDAAFVLLDELLEANRNQASRQTIVILDEKDRSEMEDEIRQKVGQHPGVRKTKIICRTGCIYDIDDLRRCAIDRTRSIIINTTTDFDTVKAILACTSVLNDSDLEREKDPFAAPSASVQSLSDKTYVVAVIQNSENEDVAAIAGRDQEGANRLEMLMLQKTLARLMVHTSRQPGLSVVFTELFNFSGMEFYLVPQDKSFPAFFGMSIRKINHYLRTAIACGVYRPGTGVIIDDPNTVIFQPGDSLLVVEEDDNALDVSDEEFICTPSEICSLRRDETFTILILGTQPVVNDLLNEYANYLQPGSRIFIADSSKAAASRIRSKSLEAVRSAGCLVEIITETDLYDYASVQQLIHRTDPDSVLMLIDHKNSSEAEDEKVLKLLLYLRSCRAQSGNQFNITSEINSARDERLALATGSDDFIISRHIAALLMAQISQERPMRSVFSSLLHEEGFEIYIKKVSNYIDPATPIDLYSAIDAVAAKHEVLIGMRLWNGSRYEDPFINPAKCDTSGVLRTYSFSAKDFFVVLAEDITIHE